MNFWKYLLILNKDKEQGFTLPLILGFGLFMLAIAMVSIKMSSTSEVTSNVQKKSQQAVAAAELGVGRIQQLMNTNRTIATYNDCVGNRAADGTCSNTTDPSWAAATKIVTPKSQSNSCSSSGVAQETQVQKIGTSKWQDADDQDPTKGQFRLISYTYTPDPGISQYGFPGVGVLIVEGRTDQQATIAQDSTKTDITKETFNTGTTRLRIEIPIKKSTQILTTNVPGLRQKFNVYANMGLQKVNGSILIDDPNCAGGGSAPVNLTQANNIATNPNGTYSGDLKTSPTAMPDTPALPPSNRLYPIQGSTLFGSGAVSLPRTGDVTYQGAYHYLVPDLVGSGGNGLTISSGSKIILYVQGSIDLNGSINNTIAPQNLQIYGNTTVANGTGYKNTNYKYGCDPVLGNGNNNLVANTCPTTILKLGGTADINAFIHAPEAWACLNGGGSDASITGALWINQWVGDTITGAPAGLSPCTSADKTVIDFNTTAFPTDSVLGANQKQTIIKPEIAPLTSWERVERP